MGHLGPRMSHPALQLWIRCKVCFTCTMKGAKRYMEIMLMFFLKEILFRAIWSF